VAAADKLFKLALISKILSDVEKLDEQYALKMDLGQVGEAKANLRSALHREARKRQINLSTSSDEKHLYVFRGLSLARADVPYYIPSTR
jgi:hypothetical protein